MVAVAIRLHFFLVVLITCCPATADYDPLTIPTDLEGRVCDLTVRDKERGRQVPLRVYLPQGTAAAPVVMFSHGLGGTCKGCAYLGEHWSARGYLAVFLQHPGSDDSVWRSEPVQQRMAAMQRAASGKNFLERVQDVSAVLNQLDTWNKQADHPLAGRIDLTQVGMSGHSFGAVTTQAVSGQSVVLLGQRFTDRRVKAAIALSPSSPRRGDLDTAFGSVSIPWLLMTGTKDTAAIGGQTVASRLNVYPHLPVNIDKYELVLQNAEHSAFTDRALPHDRQQRNPNHHRAILAISTAFWDTYLKGDAAARAWLQGAGARSILEANDRWQLHSAENPSEP